MALDLDGVLLDGMGYHISAWRIAFEQVGVRLSDRKLYLLEGIKTREVVDIICDDYRLDLTSTQRDEVASLKKSAYKQVFEPTPLDGAAELLNAVVKAGYQIAIVTGTLASSASRTLAKLGFLDRVEHIVSADMNIPGKPDPAPFLHAVELLEVEKACCLAVDNAPAGVQSARNAGLPCAGVATYLPKSDLGEASAVFDDVRALGQWIDQEHKLYGGFGAWNLPPAR